MLYDWPEVDLERLRSDRRGKLLEVMKTENVSHLILTGFDNIRYATDYRSQLMAESYDWYAAVLSDDGSAELLTPYVDESVENPIDELPWITAMHGIPSWAPPAGHPKAWTAKLAGALKGARRVGIELILPQILEMLREMLPGVEFVHIGQSLYDVRIRKSADEIILCQAASKVNSIGAEAAMRAAVPGNTDFEVLAAAMGTIQAAGPEFLSHSLCNHRRGNGGWFAEGTVLQEGDPYFFDIGVYGKHGYASDIARTAFVGQPRREVVEVYHKLMTAIEIGESAVRPGVRMSEVARRVNDYLEGEGLPRTPYSMGHGVGLRQAELPTILPADRMDRDDVFVESSVIAIEPETGLMLDGEFVLLKVEDNYVVESDGVRKLTDAHYGLELTR